MKRKTIINVCVIAALIVLFVVLAFVVNNNSVGQYVDGDGIIMSEEDIDNYLNESAVDGKLPVDISEMNIDEENDDEKTKKEKEEAFSIFFDDAVEKEKLVIDLSIMSEAGIDISAYVTADDSTVLVKDLSKEDLQKYANIIKDLPSVEFYLDKMSEDETTAYLDANLNTVESPYYATYLALLPPLIAIVLALVTKEVYSSLFIGILSGALLATNFNPVKTLTTIVTDGFTANVADSWNAGILIFLVLLGMMVALINKAGGSQAFGKWASTHVKSRVGAQLATFALGVLIFVDDYFNCLTVGSVMKPVSDSKNISRAKLAYLIDATAAPVCMIAPISSWAAAVAGVVVSVNGLTLFIKAIPYNFYSLLTIVMIITITLMKFDYGPMKRHELNAMAGDLFSEGERNEGDGTEKDACAKGRVIDLVLPVVVLIIACVLGMIYTGGFFDGESFVDSFANCDASAGLALGSAVAVVLTAIYLICRRVISFKDAMAALPKGFCAMVPAILILCFAWTLNGTTGMLGADIYVYDLMQGAAAGLKMILPAIIFLVAVGLSFATGTSWGTFGILIPIVTAIFPAGADGSMPELLIIGISACLAGAVCGDHCSPISDTTIMASAGAQCNHVNHVATQLPYAITVAAVSFVCFIISGFIQNWLITLPIGIVLMVGTLLCIKLITERKAK